ncbi:pyridoxamine 5'-phosphate oxidase family protein [Nocardiopsis sp. N85]|uniref:pyridoxamine 5'-phosphate oxidase family protein n=1 Tax=Nocardiopsis sp. N85 TaxID=3029400 RepID=UPI00237F091D|nr:pyridoxamine 5'-phosphate oxidase family protein [Nocardiopsis sp. N85]MDE3722033.1 pyridoxamine 5'-phosphate oxidase family protein [Nocardiopsis sp. N85]
MGKIHDAIDDRMARLLLDQPVFFVGTAPLDPHGHVNVSPKGMAGTFTVLDEHRVAYLDYTGSGTETIAHLSENGRIVLMFCAFTGPPTIVRLHGTGRTLLPTDPEFTALRPRFTKQRTLGQRAIIVVDVHRVSDSCGFSVPLMDLRADRDLLDRHHERRDPAYFTDYHRTRNATSIDGLPGLPT